MSRLKALLPVMRSVAEGEDLDLVLTQVLDTAVSLTKAERLGIFLVTGTQLEPLLSVRSSRGLDQSMIEAEGFAGSRSAIGSAVESRQPVISHNALDDPHLQTAESVRRLKLRSIVAVPLHVKDGVLGVLYADARSVNAFGAEQILSLEALASVAAIAMEQARLSLRASAQDSSRRG